MKNRIIIFMICCSFILSGCQIKETIFLNSENLLKTITNSTDENALGPKVVDNKLVVWVQFDYVAFDDTEFLRNNPNMTIEYKAVPKETVKAYLAGLLSEDCPDILVVNSKDYGIFSKLDLFEDYNEPPYALDTMALKNDVFSPLGWSLMEDRKIGLMTHFSPLVTYYRADILDSLGFNSEPEAVKNYLSDKNQLSELSLALKKNNQYILQWTDDYNTIISTSLGYYDDNSAMIRREQQFRDIYEYTLYAYQNNLVSNINFWTEEGTQAIKNSQLVMIYLGSWGATEIANRAPEQAGKWKVTSLPFNVNAFEGHFMMMPSKGNNKEKAWEWISINYKNELYNWKDQNTATSGYLGNQKVAQYFKGSLEGSYNREFTPFDTPFDEIYRQRFNEYIQSELSFDQFIDSFEKEIREGYEIQIERYMKSK